MKIDKLSLKLEELLITGHLLSSPTHIVEVGARKPRKGFMTHEPYYSLRHKKVLGFEGDAEECTWLVNAVQGRSDILYCPYLISDKDEERIFFITRDPKCSSLYEPDSSVLNKYEGLDVALVARKETLPVRRLDTVFRQLDWQTVQFLKADVQGAELSVLQGTGSFLQSLLAIVVEVEFIQLYKCQPLFTDVHLFLQEHGFFFHHFIQTGGAYLRGLQAGQFQVLWADAIYFRNLDDVNGESLSTYALLASLYECHHLAVAALARLPGSSQALEKYRNLLPRPTAKKSWPNVLGSLIQRMVTH